MLSTLALRSTALGSARHVTLSAFKMVGATSSSAFSTQTAAQVQDVENRLADMQWVDVKDEVRDIRLLMNEPKTNHAVHIPDRKFEYQVADSILNAIMASPKNHDEVFARIHAIKSMVKQHLYQTA